MLCWPVPLCAKTVCRYSECKRRDWPLLLPAPGAKSPAVGGRPPGWHPKGEGAGGLWPNAGLFLTQKREDVLLALVGLGDHRS